MNIDDMAWVLHEGQTAGPNAPQNAIVLNDARYTPKPDPIVMPIKKKHLPKVTISDQKEADTINITDMDTINKEISNK